MGRVGYKKWADLAQAMGRVGYIEWAELVTLNGPRWLWAELDLQRDVVAATGIRQHVLPLHFVILRTMSLVLAWGREGFREREVRLGLGGVIFPGD